MAKIFKWHSRVKTSAPETVGSKILSLPGHVVDPNAHPTFVRKGDGYPVDAKISQEISTHRHDLYAHTEYYPTRKEIIGIGCGSDLDAADTQYKEAIKANYAEYAGGGVLVPHLVTAWLLNREIEAAKDLGLKKDLALISLPNGRVGVSIVTKTELEKLTGLTITGTVQEKFTEIDQTIVKHVFGTAVGDNKTPVYVDTDGNVIACTYVVNELDDHSLAGQITFTGYTPKSDITSEDITGTSDTKYESNKTYLTTVEWVIRRITNWWKYICEETEVVFKKPFKVEDKLTVTKNGFSVTGDSEITGNLTVTGTTKYKSSTEIDGTLKVTGVTTLDSTLSVGGDATFSGNVTVNNDKTTTLGTTVIGDSAEGKNKDLTVNGNLKVTGKSDTTGDSSVGGNLSITGTAAASGTLSDDEDSTKLSTTAWVRTRMTNWWASLCSNTATTVKKLWTFESGIATSGVKLTSTDLKNAAALGTDADGNVVVSTHTHGQIANNGDVTMKTSPTDNDPVNVKYLNDKIEESGGMNVVDYIANITDETAGKSWVSFKNLPSPTTDLRKGTYEVILRMTFTDGKVIDVTNPMAVISDTVLGAGTDNVPIYAPAQSLLLISDTDIKFRVPNQWLDFYGEFSIDGTTYTMDTSSTSAAIKLKSYQVIARRMYSKF